MESNKLLKDLFLPMRNDYAGWDAKQKRHDPSPFVTMLGQAYYDRRMSSLLVLQAVSQYCAGMRDRNLKFALHDADYPPFSRGFAVRRCTEGMFVDLVTQETRLHPGDAVLAINRTAPKRIVQNLPNPLLAADVPEREQWNGYLKLARDITVRHADGTEETLELARYPVEGDAAPSVQELGTGTLLLNPGTLNDAVVLEAFVQAHQAQLDGCTQLVIDLRTTRGEDEEALLPLLPYIAAEDTTAGEIFGDRRIRTLRTPAPLKYIHALYETSPDTLWVATVGCGVFRVTLGGTASQPSIRGVEQLHFNDELEIKNFFFTLYPENGSAMWFGNRGGGAVRYDIAGGGSEVFKFDAGRSAIANDIFAIHRSGDGTMWFGTSGGLIEFRRDSTSHVPGIRNTVHGILEDRKGDLWLSTNRGLVQYSPHTGYVVTYGYSYGLNTIEYSDGACFADPRTGTLFIGGIDGQVTIEDTGFREQEYNPPMLFRDIRLNDGIRNIGDMLSRDGVLTLRHGQRIFEITVSALDYVNGSNYSYYSRLDGYNDQWTGASSQLSFADLPAGTYRLDVRYRNNITGAESPVYSLPIRLKPAWYATAAAKCLYVLLLLAVVGGVIRHYLLRLEIRRKEEVYESKMRFFSNITQELSMPLTMISAPCQQILAYRKADPYVLKYAQTIRQNVSKLHDLIYMLHEFRGIRTGQNDESENIELVPVAEIAQRMVETFGEYSQQNSIHCQLDIERNLVWPTDRDGLSTILNTLLSNAFKHTPYNGAVSLTIRSDNGKLLISASNDSVGVNLEDIEAIFDRYRVLDYFERKSERGLSFQGDLRLAICHSIVVRMQGEIKVESTPNAQTTFTVLLPQLKVTAENAPTADNIVPASKEYGLPLPTVTRREFPFDKNRRTVFIVNDNSEIMNFVAELFAADYNIKMPSGKTEMIELLKQMHPDIVICDALSEQSDCLSLIQFIKQGKLTSHIPVILLSTAQQIDERIKGVESGADICLTLPFNVEYLKAVAEQLLRRNRSLKDYYKSSISAFELSDGRMLHQDDKEFIDRMLKIINDNISNTEISTKFIADELGVSIRNLYRRLEGILNQTPTNIIKEYRLAKAEQLLTTTKLSIDEIIYKAGFVNRGTFFKCFSAKYGCTPKVYRKEKLSQIRQEVGEESADAADRSA